jgi:hypothetical protein
MLGLRSVLKRSTLGRVASNRASLARKPVAQVALSVAKAGCFSSKQIEVRKECIEREKRRYEKNRNFSKVFLGVFWPYSTLFSEDMMIVGLFGWFKWFI